MFRSVNHQRNAPASHATARAKLATLLAALGPRRISAVYLWLLFIIVFEALNPGVFLSSVTLQLVFSAGAVTCVLALAFLIPLTANEFDLSIGAVMSFAVVLGVWLNINTDIPPGVGAAIAITACTLVGAVSGFVVVRLRVNSFIATLGMSQVLLAAVLLISGNRQLVTEFPDSWARLGRDSFLGVPLVTIFVLVIAAILWFVLEQTRTGRYLFATGGNAEAARLSGVPTKRVVWAALAASGGIAGIAGVIYYMRIGSVDSTVGPGYLFPAVTAVFLGASQLSQRPNVWGTLIAYFALAFGIQGLSLSSDSAAVWSEPLFQGVALIGAVALAAMPATRRRWRARRQEAAGSGTTD